MTDPSTEALLRRIADALERLAPPPPPAVDLHGFDAYVWHADGSRLEAVPRVNRVAMTLLRGIDRQCDILTDNTRRFATGLPANNALLWGARGMGKSSLVKAVQATVASEHPGTLALVEIHREDIPSLPALLAVDEMGNLIWGPVNPEPKFDEISAALSGWLGGKTDTVITTAGPSVKTIEPTSSRIETSQRMELSQALWISGKKSEAIEQFSQALQKIGDSAILENQLRALKEPEKFYPTPTPAPVPAKQ